MQVISLVDNWQAMISDNTDIDVNGLDASDWQATSLPLDTVMLKKLTLPKRIWLKHEFIMPINEECSTWWLESNIALCGRVWLNETSVDNLDSGDIYQLEITNYTALEENVLILCLEPTRNLEHWRILECVPYPCHE